MQRGNKGSLPIRSGMTTAWGEEGDTGNSANSKVIPVTQATYHVTLIIIIHAW